MDSWKVSKKDTAYRFLTRWSSANLEYQTFCSYYRLVLLNILKVFMLGMVIPSMTLCLAILNGMPHPDLTHVTGILYFVVFIYGSISCLICGCGIIIGMSVLIVSGIQWLFKTYKANHSILPKDLNQNIVWTWLKTKKQKFCPFVEIIKE